MYATTRILALVGVMFALTALLVAGALCCIDTAVACADENDHRPQTAAQVLPASARALACGPTLTTLDESQLVATVCGVKAADPSLPQTARFQLRI